MTGMTGVWAYRIDGLRHGRRGRPRPSWSAVPAVSAVIAVIIPGRGDGGGQRGVWRGAGATTAGGDGPVAAARGQAAATPRALSPCSGKERPPCSGNERRGGRRPGHADQATGLTRGDLDVVHETADDRETHLVLAVGLRLLALARRAGNPVAGG